MKVGYLQFVPERNSVHSNISIIRSMTKDLEFDMLVLPELANSGYLYADRQDLVNVSEKIDGSGLFLSSLILLAKNHNACIVSGFSELSQNLLFNSAIALSAQGIISHYRKIHLFNEEKTHFTPGNLNLNVFSFNGACLGMMICYDWVFPEVARTLSLKGAQVICHPSNLVLPYCQKAMITRSIENKVFTITANRVGTEHFPGGNLTFTGKSQVVAPQGKILSRASKTEVCLKIVEIDTHPASNKQFSPKNNLFGDRRPEYYDL